MDEKHSRHSTFVVMSMGTHIQNMYTHLMRNKNGDEIFPEHLTIIIIRMDTRIEETRHTLNTW